MVQVHGAVVDNETRCRHYHKQVDVVAIKFQCCGKYYPCYKCHLEYEAHTITAWEQKDFDQKAILCGICKAHMTINEYMQLGCCKYCDTLFNSGCKNHYHFYFAV